MVFGVSSASKADSPADHGTKSFPTADSVTTLKLQEIYEGTVIIGGIPVEGSIRRCFQAGSDCGLKKSKPAEKKD
jgi:hypothetical protein